MKISTAESIRLYNTFGLDADHKGIIRIQAEHNLLDVIEHKIAPFKILGGGSNILITKDIDAYILKNEIKGIQISEENDEEVKVRVGAGEYWHTFVMWSLSHGLAGLENLSLIPGSVGAAPMQNIGAYGVEQEAAFFSLDAINMSSGEQRIFYKADCHFGYRESIFKNELKDQFFITYVTYILKKKNHTLHLGYGAIKEVLQSKGILRPTINEVSEAVCEIRKSKLPDPKVIGNAGSFFKNPVISTAAFQVLKEAYPDLASYPVDASSVKIPAGWLIEKAGYKGHVKGQIGVHTMQALVLVNYGGGKGEDILSLALEIQSIVQKKFGVLIVPEVNIW